MFGGATAQGRATTGSSRVSVRNAGSAIDFCKNAPRSAGALRGEKSVTRHVKLSPKQSRILSAIPRREAGAMDPATEVRLQKRRTLLAYIENTPEFRFTP